MQQSALSVPSTSAACFWAPQKMLEASTARRAEQKEAAVGAATKMPASPKKSGKSKVAGAKWNANTKNCENCEDLRSGAKAPLPVWPCRLQQLPKPFLCLGTAGCRCAINALRWRWAKQCHQP